MKTENKNIVMVNPFSLQPSGHLRKINTTKVKDENGKVTNDFVDKSLNNLMDNIKRNGVLSPIVVSDKTSKIHPNEIVTGDRRCFCAQKCKLDEIPVIYEVINTEQEYYRLALGLNIGSKNSTVGELIPFISEQYNNGFSVSAIAKSIGISQKSIYDAIKVSDNDTLKEIAKKSFVNAVFLGKGSNRNYLTKKFKDENGNEQTIEEIAKTGNIEELKKAIGSIKTAERATKAKENGVNVNNLKDIPAKYSDERKRIFFVQLRNNEKVTTIDVKKLKAFLTEKVEKWF